MNLEYTLKAPETVLEKLILFIPEAENKYEGTITHQKGKLVITGSDSEQIRDFLESKRTQFMRTGGASAQPRTKGQELYHEALRNNTICIGEGPAGTGKTRMGIDYLVEEFKAGRLDRLVLSRPAVEAGERLGHLPGDMKDKVDPYMQPLYDGLGYHYKGKILSDLLTEKQIEIAPIAFLRGRTLANAGIIIDEAQNLTPLQMKMVLTRLGEGSKMVITGDCGQIDLPSSVKSGLKDALEKLENIPDIGIIRLTRRDVVRHPLVGAILDAYDG